MSTTTTKIGTATTRAIRTEIHRALSMRRSPLRSAWRQSIGCPRYELPMIPNRVVMDRAPTSSPMTRLMASPPATPAVSVGVVKVELPMLEVVTVVCWDRVTSASTIPAGTAMTSIALAIETKLRPQILKEASSRSPTPSGRSTTGGGTHTGQAPPRPTPGTVPVAWPLTVPPRP